MATAGPGRRPIANIVSWEGGGLGTDIDLLTAVIARHGFEVRFKARRHRHPRNRVHSLAMTASVLATRRIAQWTGRPPYALNVFIESVFPEYLPFARVNTLLVNPEWFRASNEPHVPALDWLLCKTADAVAVFAGAAAPARLVHFTSPDRRLPGTARPGPLRCLHLSGASAVKGSEAVVEAWARHPEWPHLTVVRRRRYGGEEAPPLPPLPNVHYEADYVPADRLQALQNGCAVHVAPSQAEGYGHVIGEAMSCGAVVVTTDAAPMNELVGPDRGRVVRVARTEPLHRSLKHFVDVDDLERQLAGVFAMPDAERTALGARARAWYEAQDARFDTAMRTLLDEVRAGERR